MSDQFVNIPAYRLDILKIHAGPITKHGEVDYEAVVKLSDGFNGADLRNVCTGNLANSYIKYYGPPPINLVRTRVILRI